MGKFYYGDNDFYALTVMIRDWQQEDENFQNKCYTVAEIFAKANNDEVYIITTPYEFYHMFYDNDFQTEIDNNTLPQISLSFEIQKRCGGSYVATTQDWYLGELDATTIMNPINALITASKLNVILTEGYEEDQIVLGAEQADMQSYSDFYGEYGDQIATIRNYYNGQNIIKEVNKLKHDLDPALRNTLYITDNKFNFFTKDMTNYSKTNQVSSWSADDFYLPIQNIKVLVQAFLTADIIVFDNIQYGFYMDLAKECNIPSVYLDYEYYGELMIDTGWKVYPETDIIALLDSISDIDIITMKGTM